MGGRNLTIAMIIAQEPGENQGGKKKYPQRGKLSFANVFLPLPASRNGLAVPLRAQSIPHEMTVGEPGSVVLAVPVVADLVKAER